VSDESVSIREFDTWRQGLDQHLVLMSDSIKSMSDALTTQGQNTTEAMKVMSETIQQSIELQSEEVQLTKSLHKDHIIEYRHDKQLGDIRFTNIEERQDTLEATLQEREGVYRIANSLKWVGIILFAGLLTAAGAGIFDYLYNSPTTVTENNK